MKILVLNCGSSSLKFQLIETTPEWAAADRDRLLGRGMVTRLGHADSTLFFERPGEEKQEKAIGKLTCKEAVGIALHGLRERGWAEWQEIEGVGHRIVHGGERFRHSAILDEEVVREIENCAKFAPLHNPYNLTGYHESQTLLPRATHVAVFDTAFHHTLPPKAFLYGLPYVHYERDRIRRYGFHGTSHNYVTQRFAAIHGTSRKVISCHLGNGCSVCATVDGKSIDTSMGFTPLEGLMMGTRAGDLDSGALLHLIRQEKKNLHEIDVMLNDHSGLYGVSGVSNDMQDLLRSSAEGNGRAALAVEMFCYRVTKYIGAYFAAMNGADGLVFTGGIGENAPVIRDRICAPLGALGVHLDTQKNKSVAGTEERIDDGKGGVRVWVIPTNEELLIARDTLCAIHRVSRA